MGVKQLSGVLLGANFMKNHNIIFDVTNKKIGFYKNQCGKNVKLNQMLEDISQFTPYYKGVLLITCFIFVILLGLALICCHKRFAPERKFEMIKK